MKHTASRRHIGSCLQFHCHIPTASRCIPLIPRQRHAWGTTPSDLSDLLLGKHLGQISPIAPPVPSAPTRATRGRLGSGHEPRLHPAALPPRPCPLGSVPLFLPTPPHPCGTAAHRGTREPGMMDAGMQGPGGGTGVAARGGRGGDISPRGLRRG